MRVAPRGWPPPGAGGRDRLVLGFKAVGEFDPSALRACPEQMKGASPACKARSRPNEAQRRQSTSESTSVKKDSTSTSIPVGQRLEVRNDPEGIKRAETLAQGPSSVALLVMEATGKFHRAAHRSLHAGGFAVAVVNPLRSRLFAEAIGSFGQERPRRLPNVGDPGRKPKPAAAAPHSELMETLQELTRCREAAVVARTALLNQLGDDDRRRLAVEIKRQCARLKRRSKTLRRKSRP